MIYSVITTPEVDWDFAKLAKDEPKAFLKAQRFIEELKEHPKTGLGHPEPLKGKPEGEMEQRNYQKTSFGLSDN